MINRFVTLVLGLSLLLVSCSQPPGQPAGSATSTIQPSGALTPYQTATSLPVSPTATFELTIPVTPSPTPTPVLHTITNDDTLMGLAFRYGVSLEELKTANPSVNPNAMSVGSQLVIPIKVEVTEQASTPTPVPVQASQPRCYPTGDGGTWCVTAVENTTPSTLENLSVWIGLFSANDDNLTSQVAYAPLDILRPDEIMPMMAYFSGPLPDKFTVRSEIITASAIAENDTRYLETQAEIGSVKIEAGATQARVAGQVILPPGNHTVSQVWVLAVAYDANANILGARKWKSDGETAFDITVYSLGGAIDHVEVLTEVTP